MGKKKTEQDEEDEEFLFFNLPRKNCEQIIPELFRLKGLEKKSDQLKRLKQLKKILRQASTSSIEEHMKHIIELDRADISLLNNKVSNKIYQELRDDRDFDLYGRLIKKNMLSEKEEMQMKLLSKELGIEYKKKQKKVGVKEKVIDPFEKITSEIKAPLIISSQLKIGLETVYRPPVGFASNPAQPLRSYGNEIYFAYDGSWEKGMMDGRGVYQYGQDSTYEGCYKQGLQHGKGLAIYPTGNRYEGNWVKGRFGGDGMLQCFHGNPSRTGYGDYLCVYEGQFRNGRRHGIGKLQYSRDLVYEGDFFDGVPHGRGTMYSRRSGYKYVGSFSRGSITGTGLLITPPPDSKNVIQEWKDTETSSIQPRLLPTIIAEYLQELERYEASSRMRQNQLFGPLRGKSLQDYFHNTKDKIREERAAAKRQKQLEDMKLRREQQLKLQEARLKALTAS